MATLFISLLATRDTTVAGTVQPQTDVTTIMAADTDVATEAASFHALSTVKTMSAPDAATLATLDTIASDAPVYSGAGSGSNIATDATVTTLGATAFDGTLAAQDATANTTSGGTFAVDGNTRTWAAVITIGIGAVFLGLTSWILMARRGRLYRRRRRAEIPDDSAQATHHDATHTIQPERRIRGGPISIAGTPATGHKAIPAPATP